MTTRVFYNVSQSEDWIDVAAEMRRLHSWDPCYWVTVIGMDERVAQAFPDAIRHRDALAIRGLQPEGTPPIPHRALDEATLRRFRHCESRVLSMMDRLELGAPFTYQDRIRHYHRLLSFWLGMYDSVRPEVAVFASAPHMVADYVAYEVFHAAGVPTLMYADTNLPLAVAMRTNADEDMCGLRERYERTLQDFAVGEDASHESMIEAFERVGGAPESSSDYLRRLVGRYEDARPEYMLTQFAPKSRIRHLMRRAANVMKVWRWGLYARNITHDWLAVHGYDEFKQVGTPMEDSWMTRRELVRALRKGVKKKKDLERLYAELVTDVDLGEKYVYVPLHYQPERTTSAEGGDFTHQLLMVGLLHDLLPEGWLLYVREHPSQFVASLLGEQGRSELFYHDLLRYPRVKLVSQHAEPFALLDSARAVATVTGTPGWEAVVRGKPVLAFGNAWYLSCEGVFAVKSAGDLREAYRHLQDGVEVNPTKVACFVRAFHSMAEVVDTNQFGAATRSPDVTKEQNVSGLVKLLEATASELGIFSQAREVSR